MFPFPMRGLLTGRLLQILFSIIVGALFGAPELQVIAQPRRVNQPVRPPLTTTTTTTTAQPGTQGFAPSTGCSATPTIIDIKPDNPNPRQDLKDAVARDNVIVRLSPDLDLDFSGLPAEFFPIGFGRCVTLMSVSALEPSATSTSRGGGRRSTNRRNTPRGIAGEVGSLDGFEVVLPTRVASARTPKSPGPVLRFGTDHPAQPGEDPVATFLEVRCFPDGLKADGVRISGFRLYGPSFGPQTTDEVGIRIISCIDVEVSNMEVAGWGGVAIEVDNANPERITHPAQVRIVNNYIHHNQHPTKDGHASGYGVNVAIKAWAQITHNVFDFNRHAIAAKGISGGYDARFNLVLKGGGIHGGDFNTFTHQFDVHGDKDCGPSILNFWPFKGDANCGNAGNQFWMISNAFQYLSDNAIKIRGQPRIRALIAQNIFPHEGLEDDSGDDAIHLQTTNNVELGPGNLNEIDSFGNYKVCDIEGDGIDDLFLATGATWWYSSQGRFPWSFVSAKTERWDQIKVGYFDDDLRCDVLTERGGVWWFSSGGYGDWQTLGHFGVPMSELALGRFDNSPPDRPGVRRTPHAFMRGLGGQWFITDLHNYQRGAPVRWREAASSNLAMDKLAFGDFTGDGILDVLAVVGGRWQISKSAREAWSPELRNFRNQVSTLMIANMDSDDNIDDILRLDREDRLVETGDTKTLETHLVWRRSRNGKEPWEEWHTDIETPTPDTWDSPLDDPTPRGFIGRFALTPLPATLLIDARRQGQFYSPAELSAGRRVMWQSEFRY